MRLSVVLAIPVSIAPQGQASRLIPSDSMKPNLPTYTEAIKSCLDASKERSPEGVACVPAGNHCLALNSKNNTFALVSTDAAAAIMSMGSVEGFNGVNHSLKTLDKVVIRQEGKKCCVDIHKGASVFSSLPSGRVEAKKLAAQLASLYSAPLFNVKESGKVEACSPSPAESVEVLALNGINIVRGSDTVGQLTDETDIPLGLAMIAAFNVHAAHLAKIQALTEALSRAAGCIEDISKGATLTGSNLETWAKTAAVLLPREAAAARATLSLPSA